MRIFAAAHLGAKTRARQRPTELGLCVRPRAAGRGTTEGRPGDKRACPFPFWCCQARREGGGHRRPVRAAPLRPMGAPTLLAARGRRVIEPSEWRAAGPLNQCPLVRPFHCLIGLVQVDYLSRSIERSSRAALANDEQTTDGRARSSAPPQRRPRLTVPCP